MSRSRIFGIFLYVAIVLPMAGYSVMQSPAGQQRTAMLIVSGVLLAIGIAAVAFPGKPRR